jgi:hypothetical protein
MHTKDTELPAGSERAAYLMELPTGSSEHRAEQCGTLFSVYEHLGFALGSAHISRERLLPDAFYKLVSEYCPGSEDLIATSTISQLYSSLVAQVPEQVRTLAKGVMSHAKKRTRQHARKKIQQGIVTANAEPQLEAPSPLSPISPSQFFDDGYFEDNQVPIQLLPVLVPPPRLEDADLETQPDTDDTGGSALAGAMQGLLLTELPGEGACMCVCMCI